MDDIWTGIEKEYQRQKHNINMRTGMYVFRFVKIYDKEYQKNDYKQATDKFKSRYAVKEGDTVKEENYILRPFDIRMIHSPNPLLIDKLVHTKISNKVFMSLAELRLRLKRAKFVIGDIVVYWKPSRSRVRMALFTEEMWSRWKPYLVSVNVEMIKAGISWYGRQERFNESKFIEFYGE